MTTPLALLLLLAGALLTLGVLHIIKLLRKPPAGHHIAERNGKRFVRKNPKRKAVTNE